MKTGLSVVLIVKNEAEILARCLNSAKDIADEIIILDSASSDDTHNIARSFEAEIYVNDDWQGFGIHRQRAQEKASHEWILMLDADEEISPELAREIDRAVKLDDKDKVYSLPRLSWLFGSFIYRGGWYPDYVERLYPANKAQYNDDLVHEKLIFSAGIEVVKLNHNLFHYTYRNLEHYLVKSANYANLWATQRFSSGKKAGLLQGTLHGVWCFLKMYIFRAGFLDGKQGLLLAMLSGHSTFVKYAALWEKSKQETPTQI